MSFLLASALAISFASCKTANTVSRGAAAGTSAYKDSARSTQPAQNSPSGGTELVHSLPVGISDAGTTNSTRMRLGKKYETNLSIR